MKEAVASLAEMLKETLVVTESKDGHAHPSSESELDFDFADDTMWSDELAVGYPSFNSEDQNYDRSQLERARLLQNGSPAPRDAMPSPEAPCLADADSNDADCEGSEVDRDSPASPSSHLLDIERAFGRKHLIAPSTQGYVEIDEMTFASALSSSAFSCTSSGALTSSFGSVADSDKQMSRGEVDGSGHGSQVPIEFGPCPAMLPCSCSPSPRKLPFPYERHAFLPTIVEVSEEESPTALSRFWNTRERLVSAASARGGFR